MMNETELLHKILCDEKIGWWKADFSRQVFCFSDNMKGAFGLSSNEISFAQFQEMIAPACRTQIVHDMATYNSQFVYNKIFTMLCPQGEVTVRWKVMHREPAKGGESIVMGSVQLVPQPKNRVLDNNSMQMNNLLYQLSSISNSLLTFHHSEQVDDVVNKILSDVLQMFSGGRAYIAEIDWERGKHICSYEVTAQGVTSEQELLNELSVDETPWWINQLAKGAPIILSTLDDLPLEAAREREILSMQNIKSLIVMPLLFRDKVWGYAGIDLVERTYNWSNEDCQWFASLINIIGLCIKLRRSEQEAREERRYLQNLYQYMPLGYVRLKMMIDSNGQAVDFTIADTNLAADDILEIDSKAYLNRPASEMAELPLKEQLSVLTQVLSGDRYVESNHHLSHVDKCLHVILYTTMPNEVICLFSDRTEVDRTQQALDHNEKLLRSIYDNIPVGIELYNKDGLLVELNNKDLEIFGVSRKEDVQGVINFFENPNVPEEYRESARAGKECAFKLCYPFSQLGSYYSSSKTGYIEIYTTISMLYDQQGKPSSFMLINIDNTEINRAHSRIAEFERTFELVSRFGYIGYCRYDLLSKEGYASPQWYHNIGEQEDTPLADIIGVYRHVHSRYRNEFLENIQQIRQGSINSISREACVRVDGKDRWIRTNVMRNPFNNDPSKIEIVSVNYDITELKETEKNLIEAKTRAEESDRLKSAFLANMSHEIRTPLNAIVGFSGLLAESDSLNERREYMNIVHDNNDLLLKLISDILDLSKIESESLEFSNEQLDVYQMCQEIVRSHRMKIAGETIELRLDENLAACNITGDKGRLNQVISNLINNAAKFTNKGSITLGYRPQGEDNLLFFVEDTGSGIPSKDLESIFGRFVKLNQFVQGTGLGLSICKSLVEQLGGRIGVDSTEGEGSCFWFTVPKIPANKNS